MKIKQIIPHKENDSHGLATRREEPLYALQRQMHDLFDNFLGFSLDPFDVGQSVASFQPKMEVKESDKEFTITAELPGIDEKDVEVTLEGDLLTIRGEKKEEHEEKKEGYYRSERSYGSFQRSLILPETIDAENLKAESKKGILKITLPKKPEAQVQKKKIEVKGE